MVLVVTNGSLVAIRLWEGDVAPTCSSTTDASARAAGATLSVALPTAVGAGVLDERGAVLFDSRSQDRRVAKVRARLPAKIAGGTSTRVHFDVRDDGGAKLFDGEIEVLVCVST